MNPKELAGKKAAEYVKPGMKIGLGTGSTAFYAIHALGTKVKEGLNITCFPTSQASEELAKSLHIPLMAHHEVHRLDITIDGADEVDPSKNLIKGGGGALLREKIVGAITDLYLIIIDDSKKVERLGSFSVPVEVVPYAWQVTAGHIQELDADTTLRESDDGFFVTDNGNYILDSDFGLIKNVAELEVKLNQIPGVVCNGLFIDMADYIICGHSNGDLEVY
ncbi:ribose-5-phosphate isomerase RpiA [Membranicola marinus]|uniref:Ribose-5-phosphate isomerase A n=1 Tax=Membranihabitans marinus TaxID=1227546 RepID=A0A953HP29_9BACT|nr:ribose-5-phosphate isomerase RpiA [Membranihabitans marinus]